MKIFIDSANLEEIQSAAAMGILDGVTTNPSLVAKEGMEFRELLKEICAIVQGDISAEVISTEADGMLREGRELAKIHDNIVVKVPLTEDGLRAVKTFKAEGIRTNVTLCFLPNRGAAGREGWRVHHQPLRRTSRRHQRRQDGSDPENPDDLLELPVRNAVLVASIRTRSTLSNRPRSGRTSRRCL